jgi:DNA repair protein RadB
MWTISTRINMERRLPTGLVSLDKLLGGGFRFGDLSLIYGDASSGKTTLCISVVSNHLEVNDWSKVYYIDSDGKLSHTRLTQVMNNRKDLERLIVWTPENFQEQARIIESLQNLVLNGDIATIIDSISGKYRLEAGAPDKTFIANKALNRQLGFLSEFAKSKSSAVIVTGQVHSVLDPDPSKIEPVAQRLLRYWADVIVKLESTSIPGIRQAVLEKPGVQPQACRFRLTDSGIEEEARIW